MQTLKDRHVVVTGGTGALGAAVVLKFIEAGAVCHIPAIESTPPTGRLPDSKQVKVDTSSISPPGRRSIRVRAPT